MGKTKMHGRNITLALATFITASLIHHAVVSAQGSGSTSGQTGVQLDQRPGMTADVLDPVVELRIIRQRRELVRQPGDSLFSTSPLTPVREAFISTEQLLYEATDFKFGTSLNHLMQGITDAKPGKEVYGMSSFAIFTGSWDGWKKEMPRQGELTFSVEGRWNYGPPDPVALGAQGLGTTLVYGKSIYNLYTDIPGKKSILASR